VPRGRDEFDSVGPWRDAKGVTPRGSGEVFWTGRKSERGDGVEKLSPDEDARATVGSPVATGGSPRALPPPPSSRLEAV